MRQKNNLTKQIINLPNSLTRGNYFTSEGYSGYLVGLSREGIIVFRKEEKGLFFDRFKSLEGGNSSLNSYEFKERIRLR